MTPSRKAAPGEGERKKRRKHKPSLRRDLLDMRLSDIEALAKRYGLRIQFAIVPEELIR